MADFIQLSTNVGVGEKLATDKIAGIQHQRFKLQYGVDGSAVDVSGSNPLPCVVTNAGTFAVQVDNTVTITDEGGLRLVSNDGTFPVQMDGINGTVDANNSSSTPLGISAVMTGTSTDILNFAGITVSVFADEASATDGLDVQFSTDNVNWDHHDFFTIPANVGKTFSFQPVARYMRIVYTNGTTAQGVFRLSVVLKTVTGKSSSHRIADSISDQDDSQLVKAVITGENPSNQFVNFQATAAGNFKVSLEEVNGVIVPVENANVISTVNSTTATLGSGATFTGDGEDVSNYSTVTITLDSSHDSAVDGMTFEFSSDNSNWDDMYPFTYTAADGARRFQLPVTAQYFRIVYTNGGTGQTHFRVQTIFHVSAGLTTIHRLNDNVDPDRSATLVKSAIVAQRAGSGDFVPVQSTASGNLKTSTQEISDGLDIGAGNAGSETQRVSISTDDVNLAAINSKIAGTSAVGGTTLYKNIDVDESEDQVKGSAGQVYWIHAINLAATPVFLKFYNATAASVTVGTTVPDLTFPIPSQGDANGAGFTISMPPGIEFDTAITIAATTGVADNDSGAPAANTCIVNLGYA